MMVVVLEVVPRDQDNEYWYLYKCQNLSFWKRLKNNEYLECIASDRLSPSIGTDAWSWKSCIINGICFNTKYSAASFNSFASAAVSAGYKKKDRFDFFLKQNFKENIPFDLMWHGVEIDRD